MENSTAIPAESTKVKTSTIIDIYQADSPKGGANSGKLCNDLEKAVTNKSLKVDAVISAAVA